MDENAKKIESLEKEVSGLKENLATATRDNAEQKKQLEAKDSQIQRLTTDATAAQTKMSKTLAMTIASLRSRLKKTEGLDNKETFDKYVEALSKRSVDSLQDTLQDLSTEVEKLDVKPTTEPDVSNSKDTLAKDKVTNTTLSKSGNGKPANKKENKADDTLTRVLGI